LLKIRELRSLLLLVSGILVFGGSSATLSGIALSRSLAIIGQIRVIASSMRRLLPGFVSHYFLTKFELRLKIEAD
jgi:hypothetical protein